MNEKTLHMNQQKYSPDTLNPEHIQYLDLKNPIPWVIFLPRYAKRSKFLIQKKQ